MHRRTVLTHACAPRRPAWLALTFGSTTPRFCLAGARKRDPPRTSVIISRAYRPRRRRGRALVSLAFAGARQWLKSLVTLFVPRVSVGYITSVARQYSNMLWIGTRWSGCWTTRYCLVGSRRRLMLSHSAAVPVPGHVDRQARYSRAIGSYRYGPPKNQYHPAEKARARRRNARTYARRIPRWSGGFRLNVIVGTGVSLLRNQRRRATDSRENSCASE